MRDSSDVATHIPSRLAEHDGAMTAKPVRVLIVEDCEPDAILTLRALRGAGYAVDHKRVETSEALIDALTNETWSVILCDYSLPTLDAPTALAIVRERNKDIPFIIVSGTVGEETAIAAMRDGANDYFLKGRLASLGSSIERELRDADARRRRREAEEAVAQGRERFRLIVENSSDFVSIVDADGTVRYQSPTIERVLGHGASAVTGSAFIDLVHPEDRAEVRQVFEEVMASTGSTLRVEFRARDSQGLWHPMESICHNRVDDPDVLGIILSTRDISERNAAEEAQRALLRAELVSRTKSAFLANMSHELRTPLNAIIGFSELMEQGLAGPLSERQREYVGSVVQSGRHLLSLVNDILDLSKIEPGRMDLDREWIPLETVVEAVAGSTMALALKRDLLLLTSVSADLPDVFVDPLRLKQVLYNLLSNAIKFTPPRGCVELKADQKDGAIEITVKDTGVGIRSEDLPRLFREFEQLEMDGERPEGTGLGLALTKRLVEMHGGTIGIASEYGKGTTVTLTLPVVRRINASEMPRASASTDAEDIQVLIIEDDASAAELLAGHLRTAGAAVAITTNGDEALRLAATLKPRAITLDLHVPGDGWTILRKLKEDAVTRTIPVVVISVLDEAPRALALGATGYLVKPVARDALLHAVEGIGVELHRVVGVSVLLVGDDSAELRDIWETLHEVGCHVERSARLAGPMTDTPLDIALVVPSEGAPVPPDGCSASLSAPVMLYGADVDQNGFFALRPEDIRRPEFLVRRLRAVLDRRTGEGVSS